MKESIAAIKWVVNGLLVAAMLGAAWLGYKFVTEPGYLAELALGERAEQPIVPRGPQMEGAPAGGVVTSRLPQAQGLPQVGGSATAGRRLIQGSGAGSTTGAGSYTPRTTATGDVRTVRREKETPPPAYQPPVAQRKVLRVGE
ncbi:hypothetical protein [Oceanicola sp. 502str15]|uniref:hypothetical protein n=1 Tax=Oceanicola sp. 502str15 TaxID=2696061 RepID=UPI0020956C10|nr:hypothetical protein [Oceanicola sp. 502str15]MCO6384598.1 hypothetical protein [Oceanicola sp. 502str15]